MIKRNKGLSLIEMMIAILITAFLGAAMVGLFINNKKAYTDSERFARMQDNARYAMRVLTEELRQVDFWGSSRSGDIENPSNLSTAYGCDNDAKALNFMNGLFAEESDGSGDAIGCVSSTIVNSEVLVVKHVVPTPIFDADDDNDLTNETNPALENGKIYLLSNPQRGILFEYDNTDSSSVPSISDGGDIPDGQAWKYQAHAYYIKPANAAGATIPTLYRKMLDTNTEAEIAEGVENIRVLFGVDTGIDGDIDNFVPSSSVADWGKVVSIRIYLLIRSADTDFAYTDKKKYKLGDLPAIGPLNDNYHRTVVSSTVTLRNPQIVLKGGF